jgi:glycosyltransferase involved in cell wall biosynthesis
MAQALKPSARVLIIVENAPYPWDPRVSHEAAALRDAGYQVSVIAPAGVGRMNLPYERIDSINVYRIPPPPAVEGIRAHIGEYVLALWHSARLTARVATRGGFDVLQVCNPPDLFFVHGFVAKLFGKSFVFDQHDLSPETFALRYGHRTGIKWLLHRFLLLGEWLTYQTADVVLATNESIRDVAMSRGGVDPRRIFVVRNGPSENRLQMVPPDPSLKQGRRYLACYVGMLQRQDGAEGVVRAADWIINRQGRRDVTFAILGTGDDLPRLQDLTRALKLDDFVTFTGWVSGDVVTRYLCTADVGLSPEPRNGMNEHLTMIKIMEYMAMELPIVAFDLKETRYSAQDAAVYATPNDQLEYARLLLELIDDPARRERMGRRGRERIHQAGLTWDHGRQDLLRAYRSALATRAAKVPANAG